VSLEDLQFLLEKLHCKRFVISVHKKLKECLQFLPKKLHLINNISCCVFVNVDLEMPVLVSHILISYMNIMVILIASYFMAIVHTHCLESHKITFCFMLLSFLCILKTHGRVWILYKFKSYLSSTIQIHLFVVFILRSFHLCSI